MAIQQQNPVLGPGGGGSSSTGPIQEHQPQPAPQYGPPMRMRRGNAPVDNFWPNAPQGGAPGGYGPPPRMVGGPIPSPVGREHPGGGNGPIQAPVGNPGGPMQYGPFPGGYHPAPGWWGSSPIGQELLGYSDPYASYFQRMLGSQANGGGLAASAPFASGYGGYGFDPFGYGYSALQQPRNM